MHVAAARRSGSGRRVAFTASGSEDPVFPSCILAFAACTKQLEGKNRNTMIIDSHIHIFDDAIAARAKSKLTETAGVPCYTDLTEDFTRQYLTENGIDFGIVAPIATKPSQEDTINDWAQHINRGNLVSFGTIYPGGGDPAAQVDGVMRRGLRGVKLHPDYQHFFADDRSLYPLYEAVSDAGLPLLFHAGRDPVSPSVTHCTPAMLRRISDIFPDLKIIGAHMGGNMMYDAVERDLVGADVYIDISMAVMYADQEQFRRIVLNHGPERVLFATDTPWSSPRDTLALVESLELPKADSEKILWKNAADLLGIDDAFVAARRLET